MTLSDLVADLSLAISEYEGYLTAKNIARRHNNPGNLRSWGKTPVVNGYAKFSTPAEGWRALRRQVEKNIGRGLTLYTFFAGQRDKDGNVIPGGYPGYAPAKDSNNPRRYAEFVAAWVGLPADVPLKLLVK